MNTHLSRFESGCDEYHWACLWFDSFVVPSSASHLLPCLKFPKTDWIGRVSYFTSASLRRRKLCWCQICALNSFRKGGMA